MFRKINSNNQITLNHHESNNFSNTCNTLKETLQEMDNYILPSGNNMSIYSWQKRDNAKEIMKYILTGKTPSYNDTLQSNPKIMPIGNKPEYFHSEATQLINKLDFFKLVYLANFIASEEVFNDNGQLSMASLENLIRTIVPEAEISILPEYENLVVMENAHIKFTVEQMVGINKVITYIPNFNNNIINIKPEKLIQEHRSYTSQPLGHNSLLHNFKKGVPDLNLNGKAKDKMGNPIVCRNLAFAKIANKKSAFVKVFANENTLQKNEALKHNIFDRYLIANKADEYHAFSFGKFGECLAGICKDMIATEKFTKSMLFYSEKHCMAITVQYKEKSSKYVINFYDPNITKDYKKLLVDSLDTLKILTFADNQDNIFFTTSQLASYFPNIKAGVLAVYNDPEKDMELVKIKENTINTTHTEIGTCFMYPFVFNDPNGVLASMEKILSWLNTHNEDAILAMLDGYGKSLLSRVIIRGYTKVVEAFTNTILGSGLSNNAKVRLLLAKNSKGDTALRNAITYKHIDLAKYLIKTITGTFYLESEDKLALLLAMDSEGTTIGYHAILNSDLAKFFIESVINAPMLSSSNKLEILLDGAMALSDNIKKNDYMDFNINFVVYFIKTILSDSMDLSEDDKLKLLLTTDLEGTTIAHHVMLNPGLTKFFIESVINAPRMLDQSKLKLLSAKNSNGDTVLCNAITYNHIGFARGFIQFILNSKLKDETVIVDILLAKDQIGNSALYKAFIQPNSAAVKLITKLVLESNLSGANKVKILSAHNHKGISGVFIASSQAIDVFLASSEAITLYTKLIQNSELDINFKNVLLKN